jgi:hypothetical protein
MQPSEYSSEEHYAIVRREYFLELVIPLRDVKYTIAATSVK